jgi:hypothetical protein
LKVLLLDANVRYLNPTRNLLPAVIGLFAELHAFGPGYVNAQELRVGFPSFVKAIGGVDLILVTEHVLHAEGLDLRLARDRYRTNYASPPGEFELIELKRILADVKKFKDAPIVGSLLETDYYGLSDADVARISACCDFFLAWGAELFPVRSPARNEYFVKGTTRAWHSFALGNRDRIISATHFVSMSENWGLPWHRRPISVSVLGAEYEARRIAWQSLGGVAGIKARGNILRALNFSVRTLRRRLPLAGLASDWVQHRAFELLLASSRVSFTCGSSLEYPIRKFFEIPAHGALLACKEPEGLERLGFVSGTTHVSIDPSELPKVVRRLQAGAGWGEVMARNGNTLVMTKHSAEARASQWARAFSQIAAGEFRGSFWDEGIFCLVRGEP